MSCLEGGRSPDSSEADRTGSLEGNDPRHEGHAQIIVKHNIITKKRQAKHLFWSNFAESIQNVYFRKNYKT